MEVDPLPLLLKILAVLALVFLNGFFVAAEFAIVKVRGSRIDTLASSGHIQARYTKNIVEHMNAYLSACQLGITLTSLALGWLGEPTMAKLLEPVLSRMYLPEVAIHTVAFIFGFSVITILHITIGEQYPKTYAIRKSEQIALWSSIPLILFYKLMLPFIWLLNGMSDWLLRKSGIEPDEGHESVHTEEEIRVLMKESHKSGYIDNTELTLVDNIFEFAETNAREIMIPRTEMVCVYADNTFEENREIAIVNMHTRYPVCDPDKDNIIGFVHIKDLLKATEPADIRELMRPLTSVPDSIPISTLLKLMQKNKTQIALLIDEFGGTSGLVTMEDIIEEIVGEIHDEFDQERSEIEIEDEWTFSIDGRLLIEEVNSYFDLEIDSEDYDTIGGWMVSHVEIPPALHASIRVDGRYEFIIEEVDHMRIPRITVRNVAAREEAEENAS